MPIQHTQRKDARLILPQNLTGKQRAWADLVMGRCVDDFKKEGADINTLTKDTSEGMRLRKVLSNYMAQADVETWNFTRMEESFVYSFKTEEAKEAFLKEYGKNSQHAPHTFLDDNNHRREIRPLHDVDDFKKISPEAKGDFLYDNGMGNKSGEGHVYKGRGHYQLTGHDNYADMGRRLGMDLVKYPELAANPRISAVIAVEYLKENMHGKLQSDVGENSTKLTKMINHGSNGLKERQKMAPEWDAAIKAGYTPQPVSDKIVPPTVFSRSSKEEITQLQEKLNAAGYDVPVNGIYSSGTKAAVTRFQEANGLTPHGIAEGDTLKRLDEICQARQAHAVSVIQDAVQSARHEAEQGPVFLAPQNQASTHAAIQPQADTMPHRTQPGSFQHEAVHEMACKADEAAHVRSSLPGEGGWGNQVSEPVLGKGSHGHYVSDVQNRLNALNYTGPDGRFGPATRYGVEEFQKENGLRVDGFVGPETYQKIALISSRSVQQYSPTA